MSNVLIGIIGVILFIGLALAAATFFGPVVKESISDSKAGGVVRVLNATSNAVVIRNREMETITPGSTDSSILVPEFMEDTPINPVSQTPIVMLDAAFGTSGAARFVGTRMNPTDALACEYLNLAGGGARVVETATVVPTRKMGCLRLGVAVGPFAAGDMVAYNSVE